MFNTDRLARRWSTRLGVVAGAVVVGATALAGVSSLPSASAAALKDTAQCITRDDATVTDPNSGNRYYERFCYLSGSIDQAYGGPIPGQAREVDLVGSVRAGETAVYCQEKGATDGATGNGWRALVEVDRTVAGDVWSGWAWVPVEEFSQARNLAADAPLVGVPDCARAAQWTTANLPGVDQALNPINGTDTASSGGTSTSATSAAPAAPAGGIDCQRRDEQITDPNSGEKFDQSYVCRTTEDVALTTAPGEPGQQYATLGTVTGGRTNQVVVCYSSVLSRQESNGYYLLLAETPDGWGFMSSEGIGAEANRVPSGIAECGASSARGKRIGAAQREAGSADKCTVSRVRLLNTNGHQPSVECDVKSPTQVLLSAKGTPFGDIPAGKYQFSCQRQVTSDAGQLKSGQWYLYTRAATLDSGAPLTKDNGWGVIPATSVTQSASGGKVPGVPVCSSANAS